MKNDRIKTDPIKSDRIKSGRMKSDRIKTDRIKRITDPTMDTVCCHLFSIYNNEFRKKINFS
jgi:16S rRNA G966 N2-methylase RsmD